MSYAPYTSNKQLYEYNVGGKKYVLDFTSKAQKGKGGYEADNYFAILGSLGAGRKPIDKKDVAVGVKLYLDKGSIPTQSEYIQKMQDLGFNPSTSKYSWDLIEHDINQFATYNQDFSRGSVPNNYYNTNKDIYKYIHNGKELTLDFGKSQQQGPGGYKADNWFKTAQKKHVAIAVDLYLQKNRMPSKEEYESALSAAGISGGKSEKAWNNIKHDINQFLTYNEGRINYDKTDPKRTVYQSPEAEDENFDAKEAMFNDYYTDMYSLRDGTTGKGMLDNLTRGYQQESLAGMNLAEAGYQGQAMQQAKVVKNITDQIKTERMARLRAGMSESQIANQDMQMLMANVNTLNENAQMMNQGRLEARAGYDVAQSQAYKDYLGQAQAQGTVASSFAAGDAGNPHMITLKRLQTKFGNVWDANDYDKEYANTVQDTRK